MGQQKSVSPKVQFAKHIINVLVRINTDMPILVYIFWLAKWSVTNGKDPVTKEHGHSTRVTFNTQINRN